MAECSYCGANFDFPTQRFTEPHKPDCPDYIEGWEPSRLTKQVSNEDKAYKFGEIWPDDWPPFEQEYRFVAVEFGIGEPGIRERIALAGLHDWRFDYAWPEYKVAVGVDGRAMHVHGGGRHSTDLDLEKHNLATAWGWRFFHYSPQMIEEDPHGIARQVLEAIE